MAIGTVSQGAQKETRMPRSGLGIRVGVSGTIPSGYSTIVSPGETISGSDS